MFGRNHSGNPIGIALGSRGIRAVQTSQVGGIIRATAGAAVALPSDVAASGPDRRRAEADALLRVLSAGRFSGRRAVVTLPASVTQYKSLRVPPMPPNELREVVQFEATGRLGFSADSAIQYYDAGEIRQGEEVRQEVIVLAAGRQTIDEYVQLLTSCGVDPVAIDAIPSALARWSNSSSGRAADHVQFVVDVGTSGTNVLIARAGRVMFFKSIDIGSRRMDEVVSQQLHVPLPEVSALRAQRLAAIGAGASNASGPGSQVAQAVEAALRPTMTDLAREVALCARYHSMTFRGCRPAGTLVTGEGGGDPLLLETLANEGGLTLLAPEAYPRVDLVALDETVLAVAPASTWSVPVGLSIRAEQAAKRGAA